MQKEIAEQPEGLLDTIRGRALFGESRVELDDVRLIGDQIGGIRRARRARRHGHEPARRDGRPLLTSSASPACRPRSTTPPRFRYREPLIGPDTLVVSVTQSGETVDTLAAMEEAQRNGAPRSPSPTTPGSQATRVAEGTVATRCGLEIGVASTKTLTASITAMYLLCLLPRPRSAASRTGSGWPATSSRLARLPNLAGEVLKLEPQIEKLAHRFHRCENFLFLGRGLQYPVAMEGALKLKEVSYIHAEGYPAGEMKHGPIALIDAEMPVVALCPRDGLREKMLRNIEQVKAREGTVIAVGTEGDRELAEKADETIFVPDLPPLLAPVLTSIPLQMFALSHGGPPRLRRGPAAQPGQNRHRRVTGPGSPERSPAAELLRILNC